jgi:arsenate reductase-like glutaredoxin family protein
MSRITGSDAYSLLFSYILDEGYAETPEAAKTIVENMSKKWISTILEEHPLDAERMLRKTGKPYRQPQYLKAKPRKKSIGD